MDGRQDELTLATDAHFLIKKLTLYEVKQFTINSFTEYFCYWFRLTYILFNPQTKFAEHYLNQLSSQIDTDIFTK